MTGRSYVHVKHATILIAIAATGSCAVGRDPLAANGIAPVYNARSGRLEQLVSDRNGDGKIETRAFMDGPLIKYIEIDRNGDHETDRWEFYLTSPNVIDHAEEANGVNRRVTRREFYSDGVIRRVADDVDSDGRPDKWERYDNGVLARVDLDLLGKGFASRRLVYAATGDVTRIEIDPDGDGVFVPVAAGTAKDW